MRALLCALFVALAAQPAAAALTVYEFDGQVTGIYGSGPSLDALGLAFGTPVHYVVAVDRAADGYLVQGDGTRIDLTDVWTSPEESLDYFFAELLSAPYPRSASYGGWDRELFYGVDQVSTAFPDCDVLGRLYVGLERFGIDGCAPVADWAPGLDVGSAHIWHDPDTGQTITIYAQMTVTSATEIAAAPALGSPLAQGGLGLLLAALGWLRLSRGAARADAAGERAAA